MSIRSNVYGIPEARVHKRASEFGDAIKSTFEFFGRGVEAAGDTFAIGASMLLAASVLGGGAIGYGAAKLFSHGAQDRDTIKKSYDNERLKADIGYLSSKLKHEWNAKKSMTEPREARVLM